MTKRRYTHLISASLICALVVTFSGRCLGSDLFSTELPPGPAYAIVAAKIGNASCQLIADTGAGHTILATDRPDLLKQKIGEQPLDAPGGVVLSTKYSTDAIHIGLFERDQLIKANAGKAVALRKESPGSGEVEAKLTVPKIVSYWNFGGRPH